MSALGRNDAFSVVGGMPAARFVQGTISRVTAGQVFVVCPTFDAGLEFGPCRYSGLAPTVGAGCVVAVMTGTTESWIVSWDGPLPAPAPSPHYGATPPASPVDGQEWIYPADAIGTLWLFRYDAAAPTYKWEFIGGSALHVDNAGGVTVAGTSTALGPSLAALPFGGDYELQWGSRIYGSAAAQSCADWLAVVGVGSLASIDFYTGVGGTGNPSVAAHNSRVLRVTCAAGWVLTHWYIVSAATATFEARHLSCKPIRIAA